MADEMRIEYMALSELLRTERNPKRHDLPSLRASMLRWGFTQPLANHPRESAAQPDGHARNAGPTSAARASPAAR